MVEIEAYNAEENEGNANGKHRTGHLKVTYGELNSRNIGAMKKLFHASFPVGYGSRFYEDALKDLEFTTLGLSYDVLVGAVCGKVITPSEMSNASQVMQLSLKTPPKSDPNTLKVYIKSLCTLAPYRGFGIASQLVVWLLNKATERGDIAEVYLHVQTTNTAAISFYKRFGFSITDTIPDYYNTLNEDKDAYTLSRHLPFQPEAEGLTEQLKGLDLKPVDTTKPVSPVKKPK
eukprot:GHVN01007834.1.p1 GENE.GHVN01007834.1~~GHVN01007834.1.p1  ORF type:complete len:254 (-),score=49.46 GHVN01007834.1:69-764(-)